ncbi:hypothetical protein [Allohahella marinimesophila]|uniref:WYL domain-containing protein n=1 Tax=Allohahella marinimesophila TaxID=1054972 RepID=A0ABP7NQU2_9GAMM
MTALNLRALKHAIDNRHLLQLHYHGGNRLVEPQVLGVHNGRHQLLSYQVAGFSESGEVPGWRRFDLIEASELTVLPVTFDGPRETISGELHGWDEILAVVH